MKRYFTRHGQLIERHMLPPEVAATFPPCEKPLSPLGREQARMLGEKMASLDFHGKIISSPYCRALETAEIIADITGTTIIPFEPIREIFRTDAYTVLTEFRGLSMKEIKERYRHIEDSEPLRDEWWKEADGSVKEEKTDDVEARAAKGYDYINEKYKDEELLFVTHSGAIGGLFAHTDIEKIAFKHAPDNRMFHRSMPFNCSLSAYDPEDDSFKAFYCDTSFIPYELVTNNFHSREEWDQEYFASEYKGEITVPPEVAEMKGQKVLHIGDNLTKHYPYYRKLIETLKPDVIIDTGDMADEVKAGRIESAAYEYRSKVKVLLDMFKASGARIILTPGNNDLPDVLRELAPEAELYDRDSIVTIDGVNCRICHEIYCLTADQAWNFYGHTFRNDEWSEDKYKGTDIRRINCLWGAFLCEVSTGKAVKFELPYHT